MDLIARELPFGEDPRGSKRALYKITDPCLRFWFRLVTQVEEEICQKLGHHVAEVWEELAMALACGAETMQQKHYAPGA